MLRDVHLRPYRLAGGASFIRLDVRLQYNKPAIAQVREGGYLEYRCLCEADAGYGSYGYR